jgi:hypothetical protein
VKRLAVVGAAMLAIGCSDVSSDPHAILSIRFDALPSPAVVAGDTLRDINGVPTPLHATAFNEQGDSVPDAPVTFLTLDTIITVRPNGLVIAGAFRDAAPKVFAVVGSLQSVGNDVPLTERPDTVRRSPNPVSAPLPQPGDTLRGTDSVAVAAAVVQHREGTTTRPVNRYLVSFQVEFRGQLLPPNDQTVAWLVDDRARLSSIDTTDGAGLASRILRVKRSAITSPVDSVIVRASVGYRRLPVPGSPLRLVYYTKQ